MADSIINTGAMIDDLSLLINNQSNKFPFSAPFGVSSKTYVVDEDFTSGDDLLIQVKASPGLRFAMITGLDGAVKTYAKADLAEANSYKLTVAALTVSVRTLIIFDI